MLRLLHVGLGPLGRIVQQDLLARGDLATVAAVDPAPGIAGRLLSELVDGASSSLRISSSLEAIRDWRGVDAALVTASSSLAASAETLRALLQRGLTVVSSTEELAFPLPEAQRLAEELDILAREHGGRLLGTGVNPGFVMDAWPLFMTCVSREVTAISVWRVQDASTRRLPFQRKIGACQSQAEFRARVADGSLRHVGLPQSLHFLAHHLGWRLDRVAESIEPVIAERELACALGPIAPGRCAGVQQIAQGFVGERAPLRLEFRAAIGEPRSFDRLQIAGVPPIEATLEGGVHGDVATSAILLNALPALHRSAPGLHTMASIAPPHWRAS